MVEQFETGKYYKCIDADAFVKADGGNLDVFVEYFTKNGYIFVDGLRVKTDNMGSLYGEEGALCIVCPSERHLFAEGVEEIVEVTPTLTNGDMVECTVSCMYVGWVIDGTCLVKIDGKLVIVPTDAVKKK